MAVAGAQPVQADRTASSEERRVETAPAYVEREARTPSAFTPKVDQQPILAPILPVQPAPAAQPFPLRTSSRQSFRNEHTPPRRAVFVPVDHHVPSLKFLPAIIRPLWLSIFLILCLLILAVLLFSGIFSATHTGLYAYTTFGGGRYFTFQYLPTMIGMFMLLWLIQIQIAVQRMAPFIAMASMSSKSRSQGPLMDAQPTNFLYPKFFYFKAGQPILGVCMFIFWLQIFTVPLFASLYNVYFYGSPATGQWRWDTVQGIVWTLFALYLLLNLAILTLLIWLPHQRTGLKWDARSLADLIALLDRSNISPAYAQSETFGHAKFFRARLAHRSDRLGYWTTSDRPGETFYGLGEEGAATRRYSVEHGRIREKGTAHDIPVQERSSFPPDTPTTALGGHNDDHAPVDLESGAGFERGRVRYLPWYLRPSLVLLWTIAAIALYIAFLVASFVNQAVLHGFAPLTRVAPTSAGFSATNFTYSFVPALIAQGLFLAWLSVDYAHRRLQPYVNMSASSASSSRAQGHGRGRGRGRKANRDTDTTTNDMATPTGAPATRSLLLDYPSLLPLNITLQALSNRDLKVAWFSLLSLLAATLPILAGGCFWAQFYTAEQQVRVAVQPAGYYALCVFLALWVFSLPLVLVGLRKRRLPHSCTTIAEQVSWLYASDLLGGKSYRGPVGSKTELSTRLMSATTERERGILRGGSGGEGRFVFGKFIGSGGRAHLGVERAGRLQHEHESGVTGVPGCGVGEKRPEMARAFRGREDSPRPGTPTRVSREVTREREHVRGQAYGSPLLGNPVRGEEKVEAQGLRREVL